MADYRIVIPYRFPSFNVYVNECRKNRFAGANMKKDIEQSIRPYLMDLPTMKRPVRIDFVWVEQNRKRDPDNLCYARKFILDALVDCGVLVDDSWNYVKGFKDQFEIGKQTKVLLFIHEVS